MGTRNGGARLGATEPLQRGVDRREVDVGVGQIVGEIGQHVEGHLSHDCEDQAVIQAVLAGGEQLAVADASALHQHARGQFGDVRLQRGSGLCVGVREVNGRDTGTLSFLRLVVRL